MNQNLFPKLKFIFFGSSEFSKIILEKIIENDLIPKIVFCNPDKPVGRKKIITPPPIKKLIEEINKNLKEKIIIYQPNDLKEINQEILKNLEPDFFLVAAYNKIIPSNFLKIPKHQTLGLHPSLLPKYRGAAPIQRTLLNNEKETGATLFLLDEKIDHGLIINQAKISITNEDNYPLLLKKLAILSAELLIKTLPCFLENKINLKNQNDKEATYAPKIKIEEAYVDLEKDDPFLIERKIKAFNPEPGVWTIKNNKRMKILEASLENGKIVLKKIQFEGKKPQIL